MHTPACNAIKTNAKTALADPHLQEVLGRFCRARQENRKDGLARLPEFEAVRREAVAIKNHTLAHLDAYLDIFARNVAASGGTVHWARSAREACTIVSDICAAAGARSIVKAKSMVTEEIDLCGHLTRRGYTALETDLGEYIVQLRGETPSHIIGPALHVSVEQVAETFRHHHRHLDPGRDLSKPETMVREAREVLREHFLAADVGITGANFLVADTGAAVITTNEGNADLSMTLPSTHIVVAGMDKIVPTVQDAMTLLRLLARSVTGQESGVYTSIVTGPKRKEDLDGPRHFHVVLLDNGRSRALGTPLQDMLRCIRCSACMNHCPVYGSIGGHAYGWIYPGPMGQVLTPLLLGLDKAKHHPSACTLCGRCREVCPMDIPLPDMLRHLREQLVTQGMEAPATRWGLRAWAFAVRRPALYGLLSAMAAPVLRHLTRHTGGRIGAGLKALPVPEGATFRQVWKKMQQDTHP